MFLSFDGIVKISCEQRTSETIQSHTSSLKVRAACKACNQCLWQEKQDIWRKKAVFQDADGVFKSYLARAPAGQPFGVGCIICSAYVKATGSMKTSPFICFTKGAEGTGKLQLEDLLRHGNRSKSSYQCNFHTEALRWYLAKDIDTSATKADTSDSKVPVTSVQCLLSLETLWSPLGAQGEEYARRCAAHHRTDVENYPIISS